MSVNSPEDEQVLFAECGTLSSVQTSFKNKTAHVQSSSPRQYYKVSISHRNSLMWMSLTKVKLRPWHTVHQTWNLSFPFDEFMFLQDKDGDTFIIVNKSHYKPVSVSQYFLTP